MKEEVDPARIERHNQNLNAVASEYNNVLRGLRRCCVPADYDFLPEHNGEKDYEHITT